MIHPGVAGGRRLFYTPILPRHRRPRAGSLRAAQPDAETQVPQGVLHRQGEVVRDGLAHVLKWMGWSLTDVNGILGRGQMFVCSSAHVRKLLAASGWGPRDFAECAGLGGGGNEGEEDGGAPRSPNSERARRAGVRRRPVVRCSMSEPGTAPSRLPRSRPWSTSDRSNPSAMAMLRPLAEGTASS